MIALAFVAGALVGAAVLAAGFSLYVNLRGPQ